MPLFSGKFYYTLDSKGRIIVPSPLRDAIFTYYSPKLHITNDIFEKSLHIYPQEEWNKIEEKVRRMPKMQQAVKIYMRRVISSAVEVEMDKQGRLLVPASLREDAGLTSEIVIVGQGERIELWDRKEWDAATDISGVDQVAVATALEVYGV